MSDINFVEVMRKAQGSLSGSMSHRQLLQLIGDPLLKMGIEPDWIVFLHPDTVTKYINVCADLFDEGMTRQEKIVSVINRHVIESSKIAPEAVHAAPPEKVIELYGYIPGKKIT